MQVILQQDVPRLGKRGELKEVAPGYARNHLLPRKLAVEATPQIMREWIQRQEKAHKYNQQQEEYARSQAEQLAQKEIIFKVPSGEGGRLFGSVTSAEIAKKLSDANFSVDKKRIELKEPIKNIGSHKAFIRLHPGIKAELTVRVEKE